MNSLVLILGALTDRVDNNFDLILRQTAELEEGVAKSGRKKKQLEHIGYDDFESFNEGDLGKISALLKSPKKSVKLIDKTMKGWNRERSTLPEDLHYSGHELVSFIRKISFLLNFHSR